MYDKKMVKKLAYWITEREIIRIKKERGDPKPWTSDKILQQYRFCNVSRENDKVTRWIAKNWREPNDKDPLLWHAMMVARFINWPETLETVRYPEPWAKRGAGVANRLRARRDSGAKVFTGAYIVSTNGAPMDKVDYVLEIIDAASKMEITDYSLADTYRDLMGVEGIGTFMAAQIVADLKYTSFLSGAEDWSEWAAPGPGSLRGLMLTMGKDAEAKDKNGYRKVPVFISALLELRKQLKPLIATIDTAGQINDLQNLQNCLCEFFKYIRGSSRSRYDGN